MYNELNQICNKYNLITQTIEYAKQDLYYFKEENPKEFAEYFTKFGLQDTLPTDFSMIDFVVFRMGYEIRLVQSNIEVISVAVDLVQCNAVNEYEKICRYYCYYDQNGNYFDDLMEYQN